MSDMPFLELLGHGMRRASRDDRGVTRCSRFTWAVTLMGGVAGISRRAI